MSFFKRLLIRLKSQNHLAPFSWMLIRYIRSKLNRNSRLKAYLCAQAPLERDESDRQKILFATSVAAHELAFRVESTLAAKFTEVSSVYQLFCDGVLDACFDCESRFVVKPCKFAKYGSSAYNCQTCNVRPEERVPAVNYLFYGQFLDGYDSELEDEVFEKVKAAYLDGHLKSFEWEGRKLGEHVFAAVLRFFAVGELSYDTYEERVVYQYTKASLKTYFICKKLFSAFNFDTVILNHGIYVPQGIVCEVAKEFGVEIYTWVQGYRDQTFLFAKDDTYHKVFKSSDDGWDEFAYNVSQREEARKYLLSRDKGSADWISFNRRSRNHLSSDALGTFISRYKEGKFVVAYTNVLWDAQLHFDGAVFQSLIEWMIHTIRLFSGQFANYGLVIRVHPAEVYGQVPSRQSIEKVLRERVNIPDNVIFVSANDRASSYGIAESSAGALVFGTKLGMELPALGTPVIVAGDAWVSNKGVVHDPESVEEYDRRVAEMLSHGLTNNVERALKFCYFFFFKKPLLFSFLKKRIGIFNYEVENKMTDCDDLDLLVEKVLIHEDVVK